MSKDATEGAEEPEGVGWHVGGLLFFGGLSIFLNIWHATHAEVAATAAGKAAQGSPLLGVLVGVVPPAIAGYMSHDVAKGRDIGKWALAVWITCALGMALSINAQAQVVQPYVGGKEAVALAFPVMIDLATFYSLSRLVAAAKAKAERAARLAAERAQARRQDAADRRARADAERARAEAQKVEAEARAEEARAQAEREQRAQAEAQRARVEAEQRAQAQRERAQAREAKRAQADAERAQGGPEDDAKAGPRTGPSAGPGISQAEWQDKIRAALDADPGLTLAPSAVGAAFKVDRQIYSSGVFKRAVATVRAEREGRGGLRVVNE